MEAVTRSAQKGRMEAVAEEFERRRVAVFADVIAELSKRLRLDPGDFRVGWADVDLEGYDTFWYQVKIPVEPTEPTWDHIESNVLPDVAREVGTTNWQVVDTTMGGDEEGLSFQFKGPPGVPEAR